MRQRASLLGGDSGGWENGCNESMTAVKKWWWYSRYDCDGMMAGGKNRSVPGTEDHQLHTIVNNARYFAKVAGGSSFLSAIPFMHLATGKNFYLSRLVYQLLTDKATATPFETL